MDEKSWYMWLSILGFILLSCDTARRVHSRKVPKGERLNLWLRTCFNELKLFVLYIILPIILLGNLMNLFWGDLFAAEDPRADTMMGVFFIILYFLGVFVTYRHSIWRRNNISHLLPDEDM